MSDYTNIEDLGLDEITEDYLREVAIEMGTDLEVDTRQGSLYMDACEGHIRKTAFFFEALRSVAQIIDITTCTGYVLDEKMFERGLRRNPPEATTAHYYCIFDGAVPEVGDALTCSGHMFYVESVELDEYDNLTVIIESEETGTAMNSLVQGTSVIPEIDVDGLISCTLGTLYDPAEDPEDDDTARARLLRRVFGPDENGNASQIRTWAESVLGVGSARVIPRWNGPLTIKVVIVGTDGAVASQEVVDAVQEYLDPGSTGMGEGIASIGQIITVVAAQALTVDISVSVSKTASSSYENIQIEMTSLLEEYFGSIAVAEYDSTLSIRYNRILAIIAGMDDVVDFDNLLLNGDEENIDFTIEQMPVLGEVTVDGNI